MNRSELLAALARHRPATAQEGQHLAATIDFVSRHEHCCRRSLAVGHITASSWIIDQDASHALLTHHRKLDRWLQLGGHVEDDSDVLAAALREAREESGLATLHAVDDGIFDIDVHPIPARRDEPAHHHYDVRFLLQADRGAQLTISDESHDLRWFSLAELCALPGDESIRRMVDKMQRRADTLSPALSR
ncbi:MAG: NUDIX hydrolase [Gammaproteobacteria bacterium]|nr:NUDIX hydrolase [Gammaproteobacteria bacterium]